MMSALISYSIVSDGTNVGSATVISITNNLGLTQARWGGKIEGVFGSHYRTVFCF